MKRHKKTVSASIAAEGAVLDELMPLASALMDRIKILDGKVAAPPLGKPAVNPAVKPGIKPVAKPALPTTKAR